MAKGFCEVQSCGRLTHAKGLCGNHYRKKLYSQGRITKNPSSPKTNAEQTLRRGGTLKPPRTSPYRLIARTCPKCGDLITTPPNLLRKDSGNLPPCHGCHVQAVYSAKLKRAERDPEYKKYLRGLSDKNQRTIQARTIEAAASGGNEWTGAELDIAARPDLTSQQVAVMLSRSYYAVKHMRRKLTAEDPRTLALLHGGSF